MQNFNDRIAILIATNKYNIFVTLQRKGYILGFSQIERGVQQYNGRELA